MPPPHAVNPNSNCCVTPRMQGPEDSPKSLSVVQTVQLLWLPFLVLSLFRCFWGFMERAVTGGTHLRLSEITWETLQAFLSSRLDLSLAF